MTTEPVAVPRVVLAGVAGAGKTTIGRLLAQRLGVAFVDADDYHGAANRARMAAGVPLDDAARGGWLAALHAQLAERTRRGEGFVLACSALRQAYRERLGAGLPPLRWVHLRVDHATLRRRLEDRRDHFFPVALLPDQEATWEDLREGLVVDGTEAPEHLVATITHWLGEAPRAAGPG